VIETLRASPVPTFAYVSTYVIASPEPTVAVAVLTSVSTGARTVVDAVAVLFDVFVSGWSCRFLALTFTVLTSTVPSAMPQGITYENATEVDPPAITFGPVLVCAALPSGGVSVKLTVVASPVPTFVAVVV
jgi:hypothetical protein